ncbi:MAG: O-antigen ligase family protein [Parabacteroides sp.]|nr:O-antigen ligase family protein [Parabacteroides sp.]
MDTIGYNNRRTTFTFIRSDYGLLAMAGWCVGIYPWVLDPEPEKLICGGQLIALWFILRYVIGKYSSLRECFLLVIIATGLIEAIWGFRQLQGWTYSNHSLFRLTGSFFNPGPYSGYLAVTLPVALGILLRQSKQNISCYFSAVCVLSIIVVLPAGMSRSAWIAATGSCLWVYAMYRMDWKQIKVKVRQHKKLYIIGSILGCVLLFGGSTYVYTLKKDSADGRLLMWKITAKAIQKQPITGTGLGGFPAAYAETQAEYMASGKATEQEKWIAGCPEYAFNEYLQIGLEQGLVGLALFTAWLGLLFYKGIKNKRYACCGGLMSLAIFAFSSYPLQLPEFWVVLIFLGVMSVTPDKDKISENPAESNGRGWGKRIFLMGIAILGIGLFWMQKDYYRAYQKWNKAQMLYKNKAYEAALEVYEPLYPLLRHKPDFLFEAAQCLSKTGQYEKANEYLERAVLLSADPMLYYVMAKNEQLLGEYRQAEKHLSHAINILPERIYPYYLLVNLYAEPSYYQPTKLKMAIDSVLIKKPKVESSAIKEMKEKARNMLNNTSI